MSRARGASYAGLALALALLQLAVHARAGFTFPPPWIDEAQFLWQAKAFADGGTLFAPQLHPERAIRWMPPGWFVLTGSALRVLGFDYALARALSLAWLLGAFALLAWLLRRLPHAAGALLLAGGFFLAGSFVATGNVARMETLLLLGVLAGFACLQAGRSWLGLALLAATPLVHPNGVWFCAGGACQVALAARAAPGLGRPSRVDRLAGLAVAAAWLAWAAVALSDAAAFRHDLAYQLARKTRAGELGELVDGQLVGVAALLLLAVRLRREVPDAPLLACLAVPAWAAHAVGQEYWYEIFEALFELLLCVLALEAACAWLARRRFATRHPRLASAGVLAGLVALCVATQRIPDPLGYPGDLVWHRMRFAQGEPYLAAGDRRCVREHLVSLAPPGELPRVRFQPAAEGLFYADLDGREIEIDEPVFHEREPDWYLLRASRFSVDRQLERALFARAGVDPAGTAHRIHERGASERWFAVRVPGSEWRPGS